MKKKTAQHYFENGEVMSLYGFKQNSKITSHTHTNIQMGKTKTMTQTKKVVIIIMYTLTSLVEM